MDDAFVNTAIESVQAAIQSAAAEYGPQAVDLALTAYRVSAIQSLVTGGFCVALCIAALVATKKAYSKSATLGDFDRGPAMFLSATVGGAVALTLGIVGFAHLSSIATWMAALGHPEVLIAIKALSAAKVL